MKTFVFGVIAFLLMCLSLPTFAEKVIITGEPIIIEKQADFYVPATTITTSRDYYYFTVNNTKRVCYREVQPALASIDAGIFAVKLGEDVVSLHCYDYTTDYFTAQ